MLRPTCRRSRICTRGSQTATKLTLCGLALAFAMSSQIAYPSGVSAADTSQSDLANIPNLGTADDYVNGSQDADGGLSEIGLLGITVADGSARLKDGQTVQGVRVCSVTRGGAGANAGLRNQPVALKGALTVGFFAAGMFFPPAMLGMVVVSQLNLGGSYDLIIAIDGQRTRNVPEFVETLVHASAGELVYLVLIRGGHRIYTQAALR
jgi:S1-C subfamily serine protease